jgi:hypothetical protein
MGAKMTNDEMKEIIVKGQEDGAQLFRVANAVYQVSMALVIIIAAAGVLLFFVAMNSGGFGPALGVAIATAAICAVGYAGAVLGSNGAKVLVHILFTNMAILEKSSK